MGRLIDAVKVVAMLEKEAREWGVAADELQNKESNLVYKGIAKGYECAAQDVATMVNEQADGNVQSVD